MTVADMEESIVAETARTLETAPINDDAYLGASSDSLLAHLTELQHQLEQEVLLYFTTLLFPAWLSCIVRRMIPCFQRTYMLYIALISTQLVHDWVYI